MTVPLDDKPRTRAERLAASHIAQVRARIRVTLGGLAILLGVSGMVFASPGDRAVAAPAGSAVTVPGGAAFPNLQLTISQTKDLIDQVVTIDWKGAAPTFPGAGQFGVNYLQFMQCWGDDPTKGPDRTQCQYGATTDARGGYAAIKRQIHYGPALIDPLEKNTAYDSVPFVAVDGTSVPGDTPNPFYDSFSTNEVPFAGSAADGTGQVYFETETAREAPGLGCGQALKDPQGNTFGRPCWLVIVPRGNTEVDGSVRTGITNDTSLISSPLALSNWANRIVVPLSFVPLTQPCPFGLTDRNTLGGERMAEAMAHWQPALCAANPISYSFTQNTDDLAQQKLTSADPGLVFVSRGIPQGQAMPNGPPVYAPVALSGLAIAFDIESQSAFSADPKVKAKDGTRITQLNLTPRLVAKLLTQSYAQGVTPADPAFQTGGALAKNYYDLTSDPEFLTANPQFAGLHFYVGIGDIMSPLDPSDAISALWTWINNDADARAFLSGTPDPNGMILNPAFKNLALPQNTLPKLDTFCQTFTIPINNHVPGPLCTLDLHPYISSMHEAARGAARGDRLLRTTWNAFGTPPNYTSTPAEPAGIRAVLALTDTATAARYGLQTAALKNAAGNFVGPDLGSLGASAAAMATVDGIGVPDPTTKAPAAYPLTTLTYAATVPSLLTAAQGADYATFIDFAVTAGQTPGAGVGQLPDGYAPLPQALRDQATFNASKIKSQAGIPVGSSGSSSGSTTSQSSTTSSGGVHLTSTPSTTTSGPPYTLPSATGPGQELHLVIPTSSGGQWAGAVGGGSVSPGGPRPTASGGAVITPKPNPTASQPQKASVLTPLTRLGAVRFILLILLIAGGVLALAGPALRAWAAQIPRRATPPGVHPE